MANKLATIQAALTAVKADALLALSPQTRLWFTEFNSSAGYLFVPQRGQAQLVVDGRYFEAAKAAAKNVTVTLLGQGVLEEIVKTGNFKTIALEREYATLKDLAFLKSKFLDVTFNDIAATELRIIKTPAEITKIKNAANVALKALNAIKHLIKPGRTEQEIDIELEYQIRKHGGEKAAFAAIVASGPRGSLPHGQASARVLQAGEFVTIDFGAVVAGYASDITRTLKVGKVTDERLLNIYAAVSAAQQAGINAVKAGVMTSDVDKACRDVLAKYDLAQYFVHSTGHGLGIDVHESPAVAATLATSQELKPGMVITIEPGVYIPGVGGVRIEDDVLVTASGCEVLSRETDE